MLSKLMVNYSKTKVMLIKTLNEERPCTMYNNKSLKITWSFKFLALDIPSSHNWIDFVMSLLEPTKRAYYLFENM